MRAEIVRVFRFEAAHFLPDLQEGHPCGRMHGHSYVIDVHVEGAIDERGWVVDFAAIECAFAPVMARLDHRTLNEVADLANPTAENVAAWIWDRLRTRLPGLVQIVVHETADARAVFRGP